MVDLRSLLPVVPIVLALVALEAALPLESLLLVLLRLVLVAPHPPNVYCVCDAPTHPSMLMAPTFTSPTFLMRSPIVFIQLAIVVLLAVPPRTSLAKACGSYKATPEIVLIFESSSLHSVVLVPNAAPSVPMP